MLEGLITARRGKHKTGCKPIVVLTVVSVLQGCTTQGVPCLRYKPQKIEKTVFLRGYGSVHTTSESLVCIQRDEVYAATGKR
jgi:hypothetical protein